MQLEFTTSLRTKMRHELVTAGRREIGGILMGEQISPGHFRIVDFSTDRQSGSGTHFIRRPEHHQEALETFFARTGSDFSRFNYLGEWHSHPSFSVRPSLQDMKSMHNLVEDEQSIPFSILLIVRTRLRFMLDCSAILFQRGGYKSEVKFV